jgi:hypothetical protein
MKRLHKGSCHCGDVRFECELDLADGTSKCNCSICTKSRFWKAIVPADKFRLLQGGDRLADYQFASRNIHHQFCKTCGVKPFGRGNFEPIGAFYAVNVMCLDDVSDTELSEAPVAVEDGRNNRWGPGSEPAITSHL